MNVLLTCVGRRSYLVEYFKDSIQPGGRVIAANSDDLTSGMLQADKSYVVPRVDSNEYIPTILEICKKEDVGLVVSLFDIDLPYLSESLDLFAKAGVRLAVSDPWVIDIANDKWKTFNFFEEHGIATPRTYLSLSDAYLGVEKKEIAFPVIVKPRWGMGSLSIYKADDIDELNFLYQFSKKQIEKSYLNILSKEDMERPVLIQEFVSGNEYGLDVFNDLEGEYIQTVAKQKIAMRSGETDMARTVSDPRLDAIGASLSELFRHRGNMDVDLLERPDGQFVVLEINARFGGGYPFSHLSGANFPLSLVEMAGGIKPKIFEIINSVVGLKSMNIIKVS